MPAEGFKGHVATDGSLLGTAGNRRACGWSVVQLDYDASAATLAQELSVQVNIVAVSDFVFHRLPSDLLNQMSATQIFLFLCLIRVHD